MAQTDRAEHPYDHSLGVEFAATVEANQRRLTSALRQCYDFIVCGSGASGSVVARRLAESSGATVLLLEAGGTDNVPEIDDAARWRENSHTAQDWAFETRPNPHLNGRALEWPMGKVLGGSTSINAMAWARGHKNDWDAFAEEAGDNGWSYSNVLGIYRTIEDWLGTPDSEWRGTGGLVAISQRAPSALSAGLFEGAKSVGIPLYAHQNGRMMETDGGAALGEYLIHNGRRLSIFRSYIYPCMSQPNLTVLPNALVTRIILDGSNAIGVEIAHEGVQRRFHIGHELILSLGAIHTPKVLMQSGIGDARELRKFGIDVLQNLPGVGNNLQDHFQLPACVWEYPPEVPRNNGNGSAGVFFWKSDKALDTPDLQCLIVEGRFPGPATAHLDPALPYWSIVPGVVRPQSRGRIHLTGANPGDPVDIDANTLSDPKDVKAAIRAVNLCRAVGSSAAFRALTRRAVMPGQCQEDELEAFVRDAAISFYHYAGTAKMGRDEMSVVDGELKVHGIKRLRIADGSIMPRVTTGNTMAPCVIIGERAAAMIRETHGQ